MTALPKSYRAIAVAAAASLALATASAQIPVPLPQTSTALAPTSWEVSGEFDYLTLPSSIPAFALSPHWRYGWNAGQTATFFADMTAAQFLLPLAPTYRGWQKSPGTVLPSIAQNTRMTPIVQSFGGSINVRVPARGIVLHPGMQCERAVVRFVAPVPAQYRVSGQFYGMDQNGTQTQTSNKLVSNTPLNPNQTLHIGSISLPNQGQSSFTSKVVMLPAGGTLDFEVGCGPGNNFYYGSTGLHAVIEQTPVPYCEWAPNTPPPC